MKRQYKYSRERIEKARQLISLYVYDLDLPDDFLNALSVLMNVTKTESEVEE